MGNKRMNKSTHCRSCEKILANPDLYAPESQAEQYNAGYHICIKPDLYKVSKKKEIELKKKREEIKKSFDYINKELADVKFCPRCGDKIKEEYPAISRRDNKTEICSLCGREEALIDAGLLTSERILKLDKIFTEKLKRAVNNERKKI